MNCIKMGYINLQYDESITDIERIKKIIKLNEFLFSDYKDKTISFVEQNTSDDNVVYVNNFDEFFDNLLKQLLNDTKFIFFKISLNYYLHFIFNCLQKKKLKTEKHLFN